jgi:hypothetical protein
LIKRLLLYGLFFIATANAQEPLYDYIFFNNSRMEGNYFFSSANVSGPSYSKNENKKLSVSKTIFHTPGNALQLAYQNHEKGLWEAIVYKQQFRGQDHFKKADYFSFWIYNPSPATKAEDFPVVQLMKKDSTLSNKLTFGTTGVNTWKQIILPVEHIKGVDANKPEEIIGVVFSQNKSSGGSHTLYIDDIEFLSVNEAQAISAKPVIINAKGYAKHVDVQWANIKDSAVKYVKVYRSGNGNKYYPVGIQSSFIHRFTDFTGETGKTYQYKISFINDKYEETGLSKPVTTKTKAVTDEELLTMVQEACFRYYWEGAEKISGLARENIAGRHNMIASGASGFGMMALIAGTERKFITRQQCVDRFIQIVNFLEKAETFHGVFSHFIDGPTGKVEPFFGMNDNGGDLVETSFLLQGLLAARAYFNADKPKEKIIRDKITSIWEKTEWDWYRRYQDSKFLYWHWSPDKGWIINHRLIGWNETMVTYLLAIASPTHAVPASMYYTGWANQDSVGQQYRAGWGGTTEGSMYANGNKYYDIKLAVGVSNGGPLFFTHYSYLGYDPHKINDKYTNYFVNNQNIARINYRYCVDNPGNYKGYGDSCWGLTASDGPYNYSADEPVLRQDHGKIGPTGAISSFPYMPEESMKALKNYYYNYGKFLWGEYGFRDAFNLTQNWCSEIYMGLNQAPMVVMIENYRTGLLWKLFMSDKDIQKGLSSLAAESH